MGFCLCSEEHHVHHKQHPQQSFSPSIYFKKDLKLVFIFCEVSFQKFGITLSEIQSKGRIALNSKDTIIHEIECIFLSCNGIYQGFLSRPLDMNRMNSLLHQL